MRIQESGEYRTHPCLDFKRWENYLIKRGYAMLGDEDAPQIIRGEN